MQRATRVVTSLAAAALVSGACETDTTGPGDVQQFTYGFEESLAGWAAQGTDLDDPPVTWSIEQTEERAADGAGSVRYTLDNLNDAGKIWLERAFDLRPNTTYDVEISFDFATADFGMVNLWTILAGASADPPRSADDVMEHTQGDTGHGQDSDVGYVWVEKSYTLHAATDADGELHVIVGVWGTWETERSYYVDDLRIRFTER